jgi:hypothetical protein
MFVHWDWELEVVDMQPVDYQDHEVAVDDSANDTGDVSATCAMGNIQDETVDSFK